MNALAELHAPATESPLARARLHRQLTTKEAARRAGLSEDAVRWLEEGRVYRFPSPDDALLAMLLYTSSLGIDHDEALGLAGRPVTPKALRRNPWPRVAVLAGIAIAAAALIGVLAVGARHESKAAAVKSASALPPPWAISVSVLNGSGDIVATRQLASHVQALGYRIVKVGPADNFRYPRTVVYYPPGGQPLALRLAKTLGVDIAPLPGGDNPRKLVVIVGPEVLLGN